MFRLAIVQAAFLILLGSRLGSSGAIVETAQSQGIDAGAAELTPAQAQADFDVLRGALQEAHGGLYRFSTKPELDEYGALLVSHLTDKPFRYFDRIHLTTIRPSFATWKASTFEDLRNGVVPDPAGGYLVTSKLHSGVAMQTPAANPFLGKLLVLLDGGTFSTATDVSAILRHLKRATFVGEESVGTYEGNTSGLNALITLPNSKLRLKVQMYGYWNAVAGGDKGRGTRPDHSVEKRAADLLHGVDAPLETALALGRAALDAKR